VQRDGGSRAHDREECCRVLDALSEQECDAIALPNTSRAEMSLDRHHLPLQSLEGER
jgi:hypothetical protein